MKTFFICGLPRSRTAWLANFLTYGPSHCFHEPFNAHGLKDLPELFRSMEREYVGISDSLASLFIDELFNLFPESKLVLIHRPVLEVDARLCELGLPCRDMLFKMGTALKQAADKHSPLIIDYHHFDAGEIWNYLLPEVPLNQVRAEMLENFNVTVPKEVSIRKGFELLERIVR